MKTTAILLLLALISARYVYFIMEGGNQDRVSDAVKNATPALQSLLHSAKVTYPPKRVFIRVFKRERLLELWATDDPKQPFRLVQSYEIAGMSGELGPKRREGDRQVPEGFYFINRFNPQSSYHLSLGLDYPNASDRILSDSQRPGGDIFIHGDNKSIGCLAMTDPKIEEIYIAALQARESGQTKIPVHIFPYDMRTPGPVATPAVTKFWESLKVIFDRFEKSHFVPKVSVDRKGDYRPG
ncbi:MAG: L,D-transpeptidase family protein [Fimbriimonadaceae bacterium]|nr:L,D-transpeptidase family protein [Fimbriimonadaceae bacterium]